MPESHDYCHSSFPLSFGDNLNDETCHSCTTKYELLSNLKADKIDISGETEMMNRDGPN
jgi:hypothetical protein